MHIKNIISSKSHFVAPFTMPDKAKFSTIEKVCSIACSLLIGAFTAGVGGILAFYFITAAIKAKKLNNQQSTPIIPDINLFISKQNNDISQVAKIEADVFHHDKHSGLNSSLTTSKIPCDSFIHSESLLKTEPLNLYPKLIQNRRFPPLSSYDTVMWDKDGQIRSVYPDTVKFYQDHEILKLHPSIQRLKLDESVKADITDNNKIVIQQQAKRGCTAAVAAMLIYDIKKTVDTGPLYTTNLGNTQDIEQWIIKAGLKPQTTKFILKGRKTNDIMQDLQQLIQRHGSAIVGTSNDIGGHVIIVDSISNDLSSVRLRDPYHGWAITVTATAFLKGFDEDDIIQIV